jgi:hypothetical protein
VEKQIHQALVLKNLKQKAIVYEVQSKCEIELYNVQNSVVYVRGNVGSV